MKPMGLRGKGPRPVVRVDKNEDNRDVIIQYLQNGGDGLELTPKQQQLLDRWEKVDELIRKYMGIKKREEIAQLHADREEVSLVTAKSDMVNAEYVFSSSNPLNKKHKILLRIEFLEKQAHEAAEERDYKAVGMIEKSIAAYILNYPDTVAKRSRRVNIWNIQQNIIQNDMLPREQLDNILDIAAEEVQDD